MSVDTFVQRSGFMESLFGGLVGQIEVRSFVEDGPRFQEFCACPGEASGHAGQLGGDPRRNVYVGIATRGTKTLNGSSRTSGGKDNLLQVQALWVDKDGLAEEGAREEWELELEKFPFPPSMRIDSGGGEHAYWLLEEPLDFSRDDMVTFEYTLKGLADALGCDMSATDASRILRVPGTMNYPDAGKRAKGRVNAECRILSTPLHRYDYDDFAAFAQRGEAVKRAMPSTTVSTLLAAPKFEHPNRHEALTRHSAFLRKSGLSVSACAAALLVFNEERCDPPKPEQEVRDIADWAKQVESAEPEVKTKPLIETQSDRIKRELTESIVGGLPVEVITVDFTKMRLAPRYPSAVEDLEIYGNTIIMADAGLGKTQLVLGATMESAGCGNWEVAYFNAELDAAELSIRLSRYASTMGQRAFDALEHIHWFSIGDQGTVADIVKHSVASVRDGRKLLIVMDSINTLAEYSAGNEAGSDLQQTRILYNWAAQVRKNTLGDCSFLIVSESNATGGVKGRKGFFTADVVVKVGVAEGKDMVEIDVLKSRSGPAGTLGLFQRDWANGRFIR